MQKQTKKIFVNRVLVKSGETVIYSGDSAELGSRHYKDLEKQDLPRKYEKENIEMSERDFLYDPNAKWVPSIVRDFFLKIHKLEMSRVDTFGMEVPPIPDVILDIYPDYANWLRNRIAEMFPQPKKQNDEIIPDLEKEQALEEKLSSAAKEQASQSQNNNVLSEAEAV